MTKESKGRTKNKSRDWEHINLSDMNAAFSLIIRNPADNRTPANIRRFQGPREAPIQKTKLFVSFCVTVGRGRSGGTRTEKGSEVDFVGDGMEYR